MNEKQPHRAAVRVNEYMKTFEAEKRAKMRVPRWRRIASRLGWKKPAILWRMRWEGRFQIALAAARKATMRAIVEAEKGANKKTAAMAAARR